MTAHPTDSKPAAAAAANIGPDVRESRASTTFLPPDCNTKIPIADAKRLTSSGVRSLPTMPRTPETLTMRVSVMRRKVRGGGEEGRRGEVERWRGS